MSDKKSWRTLLGLVFACTACCAVPVYVVVSGAAVGLSASLVSSSLKEVLVCALPLLMVGLVIYVVNRNKKSCCDSPQSSCNDHQCGVKNHD